MPDLDLDTRIRRIEKRTQYLPSRFAGGSSPQAKTHKVIQVLYGQTVAGLDCIKHTATLPSAVVSLPVLNVEATSFTPDGVGSAYLFIDGVQQLTKVLVYNQNRIHPHMLLQGVAISTYATAQILITASSPAAYQTFYIPFGI